MITHKGDKTKLYVDSFRVIPPSPRQKFHGGGNYARNIIFDIIEKTMT